MSSRPDRDLMGSQKYVESAGEGELRLSSNLHRLARPNTCPSIKGNTYAPTRTTFFCIFLEVSISVTVVGDPCLKKEQ